MPRIVVHTDKTMEEIETGRKLEFFRLSVEERVRATFKLIGLAELFRQDDGAPRRSVYLREKK